MACCLCFSQGSKTWLALLVPVFAVFARFSSSIEASALVILFSTVFFLIFSNKNPILVQENHVDDSWSDESTSVPSTEEEVVIGSQDLYSESESMDQFSTTSSEDQRLDCSDDSISDEESLIEIAITSGHFVKDSENCYSKCCKLSHQELYQKDLWADMNEEDNLIEIDIYMGSIKYSSFGI